MYRSLIWFFISFTIVILSSCSTNNTPYDYYDGQPSTGSTNNPYNTNTENPYNDQDSNNPPFNLSASGRTLDFPYELIPDTIMALTCPENQLIGNQYFTLAAGAYVPHDSHGLQLSRDFLRNNDITKDTPYQKVRQLLEASPFKKARASLSLQSESNLDAVYGISKDEPFQGFFPMFNHPETLNHLSRLRAVFTTRSSSRNQINSGGNFAASLPLPAEYLFRLAPGLAERAYGQPILTLTYTLNGKNPIYSSNGVPHGRGYKLQFEAPYRANYLTDVQEEDLVRTRREGKWICPEELKFMVHRATRKEDSPFNRRYTNFKLPEGILEEGYCYTEEKTLNGEEEEFFETVFGTSQPNNLPFNIGETVVIKENGSSVITDQPCIKFKQSGCYPDIEKVFHRIEFAPEKLDDCVLNKQIRDKHPLNEEFYKICPAFLSVCYRDD